MSASKGLGFSSQSLPWIKHLSVCLTVGQHIIGCVQSTFTDARQTLPNIKLAIARVEVCRAWNPCATPLQRIQSYRTSTEHLLVSYALLFFLTSCAVMICVHLFVKTYTTLQGGHESFVRQDSGPEAKIQGQEQ